MSVGWCSTGRVRQSRCAYKFALANLTVCPDPRVGVWRSGSRNIVGWRSKLGFYSSQLLELDSQAGIEGGEFSEPARNPSGEPSKEAAVRSGHGFKYRESRRLKAHSIYTGICRLQSDALAWMPLANRAC